MRWPPSRGINTRWQAPGGGVFELQFHTLESYDAKENRTHRSYGRLRSPDTPWDEMPELEAYQRFVSAAVPVPAGVESIPDYDERAQ